MNANEVIDSYVRDVTGRLPRRMRSDVAMELRSLLGEELALRAGAEGRAPDRAMAVALAQSFGRPAEVARRYHERPAVIDSVDTHHFLIWSFAGTLVICMHAALTDEPFDASATLLQWLGTLVLVLGLVGWWRRRNPDAFAWRPKRDPDQMPRALAVFLAMLMLVFPVAMYLAPQAFANTLFLGAIPTAGLELTPDFAGSWQRKATLVLLFAMVALQLLVAVRGRVTRGLRWLGVAVYSLLGVAALAHATPMSGPQGGFSVFVSAVANANAAPMFNMVGGLLLLCACYDLYKAWDATDPAAGGSHGQGRSSMA